MSDEFTCEAVSGDETELCPCCLMKEKFGPPDQAKALQAFADELERAAEDDPQVDDGGRNRTARSLNVVLHWFRHGPQGSTDLNLGPLYSLLAALCDLDDGAIAPMLQPRKLTHRPKMTRAYEYTKHAATGVCTLVIEAGYAPEVAATAVSKILAFTGFPYKGKLTHKTILNWRARDKSKPEEEYREEFEGYLKTMPRRDACLQLLEAVNFTVRYNCLDRPKFKQQMLEKLEKTPPLSAKRI
jgi:hypothetical protein